MSTTNERRTRPVTTPNERRMGTISAGAQRERVDTIASVIDTSEHIYNSTRRYARKELLSGVLLYGWPLHLLQRPRRKVQSIEHPSTAPRYYGKPGDYYSRDDDSMDYCHDVDMRRGNDGRY